MTFFMLFYVDVNIYILYNIQLFMISIQKYIGKLAEAYTDKTVLENNQSLLAQYNNMASTFKTSKSDQQKNSVVYSHINNMKDVVKIYVELSFKLGNNCLQIYKGFKFASMLNIPFDNVYIIGQYNPMFKNIKQNFIQSIPSDTYFDFELNNAGINEIQRISSEINCCLIDGSKSNINIKFKNWNWIYPSSIEDFCLFNFLFDGNKYLIDSCFLKNADIFEQNLNHALVGMTIRRGDFTENNSMFQRLSLSNIVDIIDDLRNKYNDFIKIVITSDEIQNVEKEISNVRCCYFIKNRSPEEQIMILSFCDYVINNGAYYRCEDNQVKGYESTFGQIAQILNVSRKFSLRTIFIHEYFKQRRYLNYKEQEYEQIDFDQLLENSYIINCVSDPQRLQLEKILFDYHGLKFPKVFAARTDCGVCCAPVNNSYYYLLKMAIEKDLPYILIFEDDAYPCNNVVEYLKDYIKYIPIGAEMIQLGFTAKWGAGYGDKFTRPGSSPGTQASIVFKTGYEKILKLLEEKHYFDQLGYELQHSYIIDVPIFIQYNFNQACFGNYGYNIETLDSTSLDFFKHNYTKIETIIRDKKYQDFIVPMPKTTAEDSCHKSA